MKKSLVRFVFAMLAGFAAIHLAAVDQTLFSAGPKTKWQVRRGKLAVGSDGAITLQAPAWIQLHASEEFAVPAGKRFLILGEIRVTGLAPDVKTRPNIGIVGRTAEGKVIDSIAARRGSPVFGETAAAVKATDTSVVLKGELEPWAKLIRRAPHYYLAFDAKKDNSDLPNFNFSPAVKVDGFTRQDDGSWKCEFAKPVGREAPAGSLTALQYIGSSYPYAVVPPCSEEFKQISGVFSANGAGGSIRLFPGTAKAGLVIFFSSKAQIEIRKLAVIVE